MLSYALLASTGRWFVAMNYCVHTIMYGYFALRAARIRVPRFVQQLITFLQIAQMIAGCIVNVAAFNYKQEGYSCATTHMNIILSLALYASYFILFAHFFYVTYLQTDSRKKTKDRND
jgi:elongation of very long chain fatty acids protein 6